MPGHAILMSMFKLDIGDSVHREEEVAETYETHELLSCYPVIYPDICLLSSVYPSTTLI
jgi:hypothetical protein